MTFESNELCPSKQFSNGNKVKLQFGSNEFTSFIVSMILLLIHTNTHISHLKWIWKRGVRIFNWISMSLPIDKLVAISWLFCIFNWSRSNKQKLNKIFVSITFFKKWIRLQLNENINVDSGPAFDVSELHNPQLVFSLSSVLQSNSIRFHTSRFLLFTFHFYLSTFWFLFRFFFPSEHFFDFSLVFFPYSFGYSVIGMRLNWFVWNLPEFRHTTTFCAYYIRCVEIEVENSFCCSFFEF